MEREGSTYCRIYTGAGSIAEIGLAASHRFNEPAILVAEAILFLSREADTVSRGLWRHVWQGQLRSR
jgi:hypothetical protein